MFVPRVKTSYICWDVYISLSFSSYLLSPLLTINLFFFMGCTYQLLSEPVPRNLMQFSLCKLNSVQTDRSTYLA